MRSKDIEDVVRSGKFHVSDVERLLEMDKVPA